MMDDLLLAVDVLLGECKGTLQVDQHDGHRRIANTIDKLRARIQQRLDTGGWIPVAERLPEDGKRVFVTYINSHGHQRRTIAHHAPKHTVSASHWEDAETDDTDDGGSWEPEGWWEDYTEAEYINKLPDTVIAWQPLPPLPKEPK